MTEQILTVGGVASAAVFLTQSAGGFLDASDRRPHIGRRRPFGQRDTGRDDIAFNRGKELKLEDPSYHQTSGH